MYCSNCGREIEENARYCPYCGARQETEDPSEGIQEEVQNEAPSKEKQRTGETQASQAAQNTVHRSSNRKKGKLWKRILITVLLIFCGLIVAAGIFLLTYHPEISLDQAAAVTFDGYDGYGTAEVSLDADQFAKKNAKYFIRDALIERLVHRGAAHDAIQSDEEDADENSGDDIRELTRRIARAFLNECVTAAADRTDSLANGDEVTVSISADSAAALSGYGVKVSSTAESFQAAGLDAITEVDAFENVEVTTWGASSVGQASISLSDCPYTDYLDYELDKDTDLANGDIVTVTASYKSDDSKDRAAKEQGVAFKTMEQEYIVDGLEDREVVDPFTGVDVVFTGISPDGEININSDGSPYRDYLTFEADRTEGLANGDTVTVTAKPYYDSSIEDLENDYNVVIDESLMLKTFDVSGLSSYITADEVLFDNELTAMQEKAGSHLQDEMRYVLGGYVHNVYSNASYIGNIICSRKENAAEGDANIVFIVYEISAVSVDDQPFTFYNYIALENVTRNMDGTLNFNDNKFFRSYNENSAEHGANGFESASDLDDAVVNYYKLSYNIQDNLIPKE